VAHLHSTIHDARRVPQYPLGERLDSHPRSTLPEHASPLLRLKAFLDRIGIGDWFTAYRTDEPTAARFRARQLQAVTRMTPLAMGANLANVALVVTVFWSTPSRDASLVWASVVTFVALTALYRWHVKRRAVARDIASRRALRRATAHAAILAACWAMLPLLLHANAPAREQMLVTTVVAGMLGAGGFMLATVPMAATAYVIVMAFGAAAALLYSSLDLPPQMGGLLTAYCVIIIGSIWSTARLFGARLMAEAEAERQNEVIGLLLRDFEEHASDVLWDIGADGRLRQVSPRLTELFGLRPEQLIGASALDLLASLTPDDDEAREHLGKLRALAKAREPFRDQLIAVQRNGQTHWWSLSAKPLRDAQGHHAGWRGVASDVTDARNAHHQLRWLAHNDALTGLANRHQFRHLAAQRLGDEGAGAIAVLCLDLDHFKTVNDSLGHAAGDALLRRVGERLRAATRRSDIVARLGGDEFAVLMHAANTIEIELMAARLIEALREPCEIDGMRVDSRASIGVAIAQRDGRDIDTLMNHADLSLYAAKAAGRDEVRFFTPDLARSSRRRVMLEQALRQALARHELRLVFQPVGSFAAWEVLGFEALLRWQHADLGDVPPAEFIPVAEEAGLMPAIGGWVLDEACRQAAGWVAPMMVSVNVSPMQMMVPAFVERVRDAAMSAGLPLWRLELEITESVLLQETQSTGDTLRSLHRAGVRMALDDFGTGYSALSYLRRFPLHTLKIDRSFVRELSSRSDAREIVKMIVGLARTLDMRTIAEGVEEPAHATLLARDGCGAMQGWLLSAPLEADEVSPFLRGWPTRPRPLFEAMAPAWARPEGIAR
jgi:diguanylate cyclase (GGDEF)-like protein/PAS domain S-box-containing protein